MTEKTFEEGLDKGAELAALKFAEEQSKRDAEEEAARRAAEDEALGLDPRKTAYIRENFPNGDMNVDDWQALNEFLAEQEGGENG